MPPLNNNSRRRAPVRSINSRTTSELPSGTRAPATVRPSVRMRNQPPPLQPALEYAYIRREMYQILIIGGLIFVGMFVAFFLI